MSERIDYSHHVRKHDSRAMRVVLAVLGLAFVGIGIGGLLLPVLWIRRVGVAYRRDAYLSPVATRFIELLKSRCGSPAT